MTNKISLPRNQPDDDPGDTGHKDIAGEHEEQQKTPPHFAPTSKLHKVGNRVTRWHFEFAGFPSLVGLLNFQKRPGLFFRALNEAGVGICRDMNTSVEASAVRSKLTAHVSRPVALCNAQFLETCERTTVK
jgi:hypothetical protein